MDCLQSQIKFIKSEELSFDMLRNSNSQNHFKCKYFHYKQAFVPDIKARKRSQWYTTKQIKRSYSVTNVNFVWGGANSKQLCTVFSLIVTYWSSRADGRMGNSNQPFYMKQELHSLLPELTIQVHCLVHNSSCLATSEAHKHISLRHTVSSVSVRLVSMSPSSPRTGLSAGYFPSCLP